MTVDVLIEISKGGLVKYELDKKTGQIRVDRFLHGAMYFPFNYGFIPNTLGEDNDPLDTLVLSAKSVAPGAIMACSIIGLLEMEDEAGVDTKIVAVPEEKIDPLFGKITNIEQIDESNRKKIKNFWEHYKDLEKGKWVKVKDWRSRQEAEKEVEKARQRFTIQKK